MLTSGCLLNLGRGPYPRAIPAGGESERVETDSGIAFEESTLPTARQCVLISDWESYRGQAGRRERNERAFEEKFQNF